MTIEGAIQSWALVGIAMLAGGVAIRRSLGARFIFARSIALSIPLTWMLTPTLAVGTIVLPLPAGAIVIMDGIYILRGIKRVQGPNLANLPFACILLFISFGVVTSICYLSSRKRVNPKGSGR